MLYHTITDLHCTLRYHHKTIMHVTSPYKTVRNRYVTHLNGTETRRNRTGPYVTLPLLDKLTRIITTAKQNKTTPHLALPQHDASQPRITAPLLFFPVSTLQNRRKTKQNYTAPYLTTTILTTTVLYSTLPLPYQTSQHPTRPYSASTVLLSTTLHLTKTRQNATAPRFTGPIPINTGQYRNLHKTILDQT